ncbi:PhzF family phenazine biosynthesis protein [Lichenihabitans sp. Uapishka_5]|uniref:PhzF family phenazine biosynthesis protein n=1 Tax=Lichenihabitans sp. Uapishka_5 TaxID=3037302 RepID=UPI0029E7D708|nr:PhzF family phenazine biosynthesis protein [Lichenihabitans sp. Uapishka_5]MDX7951080.1 PhzF family phenazine biosynthesis protein [Lichenihabitans sp. Uapishka_5]
MPHPFHVVDVFTDTALAGNPLAVVLDAGDIPDDRAQAIAREFNLSETVFVADPRDAINTARLRIYTPTRELPFAGHPTVGVAALLAVLRAPEMLARQDLAVVLEERIGAVECIARWVKGRLQASFSLPKLPKTLGEAPSPRVLAEALGLAEADIGFDDHVPMMISAGVAYHFVPLAPGAIARLRPPVARWPEILPAGTPTAIYAYSRDVAEDGSHVRARMFAAGLGIDEDPATGSAVAALAGAIMAFEALPDGDHTLVIEQGYEMGRPSRIVLGLVVEAGVLASASIGGGVVRISEGTLHL